MLALCPAESETLPRRGTLSSLLYLGRCLAGEESEVQWKKIHATCDKAKKSADRQVAQLEGQLKLAHGAQVDARRALGKARAQLSTLSSSSSFLPSDGGGLSHALTEGSWHKEVIIGLSV